MSGIAGWVDFKRDLAEQKPVIDAMTDTLRLRGPEAGGTWLSRHALLGRRRMSALDTETSAPLTLTNDTGTVAVVAHSGEVYNHGQLRAQLAAHGHRFTGASDTEVVLHAYVQWGPEFVQRLEGVYAVAVWDPSRCRLVLARDRMGVKPMYWAATPDGLIFGSEPKAILAHPAFIPELDTDGLRDILSVAVVPGRAVFKGMRELQPGSVLVATPAGTTEQRYWSLRVADHTDDLATTIRTVRELLAESVARHMQSRSLPSAMLSGGLDSSSLTAMAAGFAERHGLGTIRSYAVNDELPGSGFSGNEDHIYARIMSEHAGTAHSEVRLKDLDLLDPALRNSVLSAYDLPVAKGDQYASLYELFSTVREHSDVAISGECGDDVFAGYNWQRRDEWVLADTYPWVHEGRERYAGNEHIFHPGLVRDLDLHTYEHDTHSTACAEISAAEHVADRAEARHREVTYLALTRHSRVLLDRLDRLGKACGVEIRIPFVDHHLLEYAFNVPWSMKSFDGREKSLLRAATRDILPDKIADRVKTPFPNLQDNGYDRALRARLADVVKDPASPIAPLLSDTLRKSVSVRAAAGVPEPVSRPVLETVLQMNDWMTRHSVRLSLQGISV
jgi:asparagine synthase (glutamine-hydrolysing)